MSLSVCFPGRQNPSQNDSFLKRENKIAPIEAILFSHKVDRR